VANKLALLGISGEEDNQNFKTRVSLKVDFATSWVRLVCLLIALNNSYMAIKCPAYVYLLNQID